MALDSLKYRDPIYYAMSEQKKESCHGCTAWQKGKCVGEISKEVIQRAAVNCAWFNPKRSMNGNG